MFFTKQILYLVFKNIQNRTKVPYINILKLEIRILKTLHYSTELIFSL